MLFIGGGCEAGWVMYNDYCYYISDGTSWGLRYYYAETRCNQRQAHLATIDSREERFFLYSITYVQVYELCVILLIEIHGKSF